MKEYTSTRIWLNTIKNLRMIYALTGESMVSIMDKLVLDELNRQKILLESKTLEDKEKEV